MSSEGGLEMSSEVLQGWVVLWNRGSCSLLLPHSTMSEGRFVCIWFSVLICRDGFVLIVFLSQNETLTVPN